ncbi:MAG: tRNA (adenosine(37)-N6)-threonylcarbamoyltransferase complex ATPase subunit type 1 TsaE [Porphyromonadaceae bacterium]|jgi:tRNA threonylcarbamoyladenosine biosynthesis protein TsaE|nr:tRNA (adenosine(37)-N6)-threonylcarbamoyltransferase complex ATPase subunit type 1 TsaE [Porphyromonadaceae bacterium]
MILASHEDTLNLGKKIGDVLKPGDILLLEGDLGAGKTTFTQGLAEGLGVDEFVNSPTFVIINEYFSGHLPLYHMDLYRLEDEAQLYDLGVEEYFFGNGVSVVEWPEIALSLLPEAYTRLTFLREGQGREVKITTRGNDYHIEEAFNEYFSL